MTNRYIMESREESIRLDRKTDPKMVEKHALWAGLKPGMRVADLGCGPGKTTFYLNKLVQPSGSAVGVDNSKKRIDYAQEHYLVKGVEFIIGDICKSLDYLGLFDFIWVRFVLEHYRSNSFDIVKNISSLLKPGGIICLVDLDHNCLSHYGISPKIETALFGIMRKLEKYANFDPYAGRKLYSHLYDLGYQDIQIDLSAHHLIFGELKGNDKYNWTKKIEIAGKNSGHPFEEFDDGFEGFQKEFNRFFSDPRRFTYTPIIACRGRKL